LLIGVISDTHISGSEKEIPPRVYEIFKRVDLILHAGDLVDLSVLDMLSAIAPVNAVAGNMDLPETKAKLPAKMEIKAGAFTIGLIHGWGAPVGIRERIIKSFPQQTACCVYGHTHHPYNQREDGVLFFNPGSATDTVFSPFRSVGLLKIEESIEGEIVRL